ncbi:MAG: sigma-B regulation protein RsbU (phosphoserine phosphatase) [Rhodothermales bacterium]|jgi:sigma-B regulation protein RsbU (phosphoserine phosphatase)
MGHTTVCVDDGEAAWQLLQTEPFHTVISDWIMPGMDGVELCKNLRQQSLAPYTYFILMTVMDRSPATYELAINSGVDDFLVKPVRPHNLRMRLLVAGRLITFMRQLGQNRNHVPICAHCKKIRDEGGSWHTLEGYLCDCLRTDFTHGICPECFTDSLAEMRGETKLAPDDLPRAIIPQ